MSIRGVLAIVGVLSALLLAAGCGSDEGDATGSSGGGGEVTVETGSLSKAEYLEQANAICAKNRGEIGRAVGKFLEETNENPPKPTEEPPAVEFLEETYLPGFQQQVDEVSAIDVPAGGEEKVSAFLRALQDMIDTASAEPQAFIDGDISLDKANELAKAYGLNDCADI